MNKKQNGKSASTTSELSLTRLSAINEAADRILRYATLDLRLMSNDMLHAALDKALTASNTYQFVTYDAVLRNVTSQKYHDFGRFLSKLRTNRDVNPDTSLDLGLRGSELCMENEFIDDFLEADEVAVRAEDDSDAQSYEVLTCSIPEFLVRLTLAAANNQNLQDAIVDAGLYSLTAYGRENFNEYTKVTSKGKR